MNFKIYFFGVLLLVVTDTFTSVLSKNISPMSACPANCTVPACRCSGEDIPGNLPRAEIPQFVFLTFDDAVHVTNFPFYKEVLNRKNPNNESITATFFVTHDYTVYPSIHDLWRNGHDIALHSISGGRNGQEYWKTLNATMWAKELVQQRNQISVFANIPENDITGVRAPLLQMGGDTMYNVLYKSNFKWDASRTTDQSLWPYTNDYDSTQKCQVEPCPVGQYPGFWSVPVINFIGQDTKPCLMADACLPVPRTEDGTFDLLYNNFQNHYKGHRAPYGIFTRHGWVNGTASPGDDQIWQRRLGYIRFLDYLATLPDVYIVSISRALEWVKDPKPLSAVADFPHFKVTQKPNACPNTFSCQYRTGQNPFPPPEERWLHSCSSCPRFYPWVGNHLGKNGYSKV